MVQISIIVKWILTYQLTIIDVLLLSFSENTSKSECAVLLALG